MASKKFFNSQINIESTGTANDPTLAIDTTSSSTFNHAIEAFNSNLTNSEGNYIFVGKEGSTKNTGYIGYKYIGAGSNDNILTFGHWASDNLMNLDGTGQLGLGTESPSAKLHVRIGGIGGSANDEVTGVLFEGDRHDLIYKQIRTAASTDWNSTTLRLQTRVDSTNMSSIDFVTTAGYERHIDINTASNQFVARFTHGAKMGISTTDPQEKLHIVSSDGANIILNSNTGAENSGIFMTEGAAATPYQSGAYVHYDGANNQFKIKTGGTTLNTRLTINRDSGNATFHNNLTVDGTFGLGFLGDPYLIDGDITNYRVIVNGMIYTTGSSWNGGGSESNRTDVALVIDEGDAIYTRDSSAYLRTLIKKDTGDNIQIGEAGTSLIDNINFYSGSSCSYNFFNNTSPKVSITSTGLGINTSSPGSALHTYGTGTVARLQSNSGYVDMMLINSTSSGFLNLDGSVMNFYVGGGASTDKQLRINPTGHLQIQMNNNSLVGVLSRTINIGYQGASGYYDIDPVAVFGANKLGGFMLLEVHGWQTRLNCGYIYWRNNGGSGPIGSGGASYEQTAYNGSGGGDASVSVATVSSSANVIRISFSGWHTNSHSWQAALTYRG